MMTAVVIVPTYNEKATIRALLDAVLSLPSRFCVLVVDDGSPDGTGAIVTEVGESDARVTLLERNAKAGLGSAYRAGYARLLASDVDVICQMDADLSHDPSQLEALLSAVDEGADVAIGSRYVPGGDIRGWSLIRIVLSRAANVFVRILTGCPIRDATSGYRAYRASVLARIGVTTTRSDGYAFQIEMTLRAVNAGLDVREVPITFVEREHGRSKLTHSVALEAFTSVMRWGWRLRRGRGL